MSRMIELQSKPGAPVLKPPSTPPGGPGPASSMDRLAPQHAESGFVMSPTPSVQPVIEDEQAGDYPEPREVGEASAGCDCCCKGTFCGKCITCIGSWTGLTLCCCTGVHSSEPIDRVNKSQRYCTDIPCLLLILGSIAAQVFVMLRAGQLGADPYWLINYTDYNGELCNSDNPDGTFGAWPDVRYPEVLVCVENCTMTDAHDDRFVEVVSQNPGYPSINVFDSVCFPNWNFVIEDTTKAAEKAFDVLGDWTADAQQMFDKGMADIVLCQNIILGSAFIALILAYIYGVLLERYGHCIVWSSLFIGIGSLFCVGFFCYYKAEAVVDSGWEKSGNWMWYFGVGVMSVAGLIFLIVLGLRDRINLAIAVLKQAAVAQLDMPVLYFIPIMGFILGCAWFLFWLMSFLYTISVFDREVVDLPNLVGKADYFPSGTDLNAIRSLNETLGPINATAHPYQYVRETINTRYQYLAFYEVYVLLWVLQFVIYFSYMSVAGAYADWYFSDWKDPGSIRKGKIRGKEKRQLGRFPVMKSIWRCLRYHMGSLAVGAGLIAFFQYLRAALLYLEKTSTPENPNPIQKTISKALHCILCCLECIFDKLNKNGFVMCSIYGTPFCASSVASLRLLLGNILRAAAVHIASSFLEKVGKFLITCSTTAICIYIIYIWDLDEELSSIVWPALVIFLLAYIISAIYMMVLQVGVDTMFMCFLVDEKCNRGQNKMFASKALLKIVGESTEANVLAAAELQRNKTFRRDGDLKPLEESELASTTLRTIRAATIRGGGFPSLRMDNVAQMNQR